MKRITQRQSGHRRRSCGASAAWHFLESGASGCCTGAAQLMLSPRAVSLVPIEIWREKVRVGRSTH